MGCVGGRGEWATFANCIGRSLPPNFEKILLILYNLVLNVRSSNGICDLQWNSIVSEDFRNNAFDCQLH